MFRTTLHGHADWLCWPEHAVHPTCMGPAGACLPRGLRPSSSLEKVREQRVKVPVVGGEGRCRKDTCIAGVWTPEAASWEAGLAG